MGKAIWDDVLLKHGWEKIPNWECLFVHREKGLLLSVYVDDIKLAGKKQNLDPMWKVLNKEVDLGDVLKDNVKKKKKTKILLTFGKPCWNREFPQEELKIYHVRKKFESLRSYDMEGHSGVCSKTM